MPDCMKAYEAQLEQKKPQGSSAPQKIDAALLK
jgi:hypothetical protein